MSSSNIESINGLAYPLHFDADKGQFEKSADYNRHVAGLIRQVLLTAPGERINRPRFGTPISQMLFAPLSPEIASMVEAQILRALNEWLGDVIRVGQISTQVVEQTTLEIRIDYSVLATGISDTLNESISA
jgi:phage baseplate assembly protein W